MLQIRQIRLAIMRETVEHQRRERDVAHHRYQPSPSGSAVRLMLLQSICLAGLFKDSAARGDLLTARHIVMQMINRAELTNDMHTTIAAYTCMIRLAHVSGDYNLAAEYEVRSTFLTIDDSLPVVSVLTGQRQFRLLPAKGSQSVAFVEGIFI